MRTPDGLPLTRLEVRKTSQGFEYTYFYLDRGALRKQVHKQTFAEWVSRGRAPEPLPAKQK